MSNLLEQAIIDATALKEAALKSAEASLVDKYSKELKESVEKLLEADENAQPPESPAAQGQGLEGSVPENAEGSEKISEKDKKSVAFKDIPSSFLDGPDEELITINFNDLNKELKKSMSPEDSEQEMPSQETEEQPAQQALSEQVELDEDMLEEMSSCGSDYKKKKKTMYEDESGMNNTGDQEELEEEVVELDEEKLEELTQVSPSSSNDTRRSAENEANKAVNAAEILQRLQKAQAALATATADEKAKKTAADQAKQVSLKAKEELADAQAEQSTSGAGLEEEIGMDVGKPRTFKKGWPVSDKDQEEAFNALAGKLTIYVNEEISKVSKKLVESEKNNKILTDNLNNYKQAVKELKEQVEIMSVTNAKLLYTNKVLDNVSLNERQKQSVVESLSRATSVKEAKTIYETLQSTVQTVSDKKQKESLSEALNRGSSPFLVRAKNQRHDDVLTERMKILAGIK